MKRYEPHFAPIPVPVGATVVNDRTGESMLITGLNKATGWRDSIAKYCSVCFGGSIHEEIEEYGDGSLEHTLVCLDCGHRHEEDKPIIAPAMTYGGPSMSIIRSYT